MAANVKRIKTKAVVDVPQSKDDVVQSIFLIGMHQRDRQKIEAAMNDELAKVREGYEADALVHASAIATLTAGVQTWCEANRVELTANGKTKTVAFASGEVKWRVRPPSVAIRAVDAVLQALKNLSLERFIRTKEEINKEAILAEPEAVSGVRGIKVVRDVEDFVIEPFETKLEQVA